MQYGGYTDNLRFVIVIDCRQLIADFPIWIALENCRSIYQGYIPSIYKKSSIFKLSIWKWKPRAPIIIFIEGLGSHGPTIKLERIMMEYLKTLGDCHLCTNELIMNELI